jgi:hypothetical protein
MGYRNYIARLSKKEYEKIKNFSKQELYNYKGESLDEDMGYVGVYDVAEESLYNFGKYVDGFDKSFFKPVFLNKELQEYFTEEHDFYIVGEEFLKAMIEVYANKIRDYYKELTNPFFKGTECISDFLNSSQSEYISSKNKHNHILDFSKITQEETNALYGMIDHIKSMSQEWGVCVWKGGFGSTRPYELNDKPQVTSSWKFEYVQFELVRIYKTFDWENNLMIYYGY